MKIPVGRGKIILHNISTIKFYIYVPITYLFGMLYDKHGIVIKYTNLK